MFGIETKEPTQRYAVVCNGVGHVVHDSGRKDTFDFTGDSLRHGMHFLAANPSTSPGPH